MAKKKSKGKIVDILEKELTVQYEDNPQDYLFVSDIEEPCNVKLWHRLHGTQTNPLTISKNFIFRQGDEIHRLIVTAFLESKEINLISAEPFLDLGGVHGRCDAIISFRREKDLYIVEIKSVNPYAMKYVPKRAHVLQLQTYLYGYKIDKGMLVYYNKGTQTMKEIPIKSDNKKIEKLLKDLDDRRKKLLKMTELPPKPNKKKWEYDMCKWCQFSENCKYQGRK